MVLLPKETYVGERENRRYHGHGTLTFRDGDKYVGDSSTGKNMVKEHKLGLMVESM